MRILNLYAGAGGNRAEWGDEHEITAVEYDEEIAAIYKERFPKDTVIVSDAHQYLLEHYNEFDFIWSSPPCPTHGLTRMWRVKIGQSEAAYPDMKLWQEIIFLKHFFKGGFVVENVNPYYEPLIAAIKLQRHLFWSNFIIPKIEIEDENFTIHNVKGSDTVYGLSLKGRKMQHRKDSILRNQVNPKLGKYILDLAQKRYTNKNTNQESLWD